MPAIPTTLSPAQFAYFELGLTNLYDWNIEVLEAIGHQEDDGKPVSLVAANGSGKTAIIIAVSVLWFLRKYPQGQVVITSGSFKQVEKQLWPAMRVHADKFPDWKFLKSEIQLPDGGFAFGFSTDNAGRAEGHHPKINESTDPVMIICDEAKTIKEEIFEAFDRCTALIRIYTSSPGGASGEFYESHHSNKSLFWTRKVTSLECPHIPDEKRQRDAVKHGVDSPLYRSMHKAEFTGDDERLILSPDALKRGTDITPMVQKGENVAFFDFAAGGDENTFYLRRGNVVKQVDAWTDSNTVQAVRRFIRLARAEGLQPYECWGDADGLGLPMIKQFSDEGFPINEFRGGANAIEDEYYVHAIAEAWITSARKIEKGQIIFEGGVDPTAARQLTTRFIEWNDKGLLKIEKKEDMAKRGLKSPDRGDGIVCCIYCGSHMSGTWTGGDVEDAEIPQNDFGVENYQF